LAVCGSSLAAPQQLRRLGLKVPPPAPLPVLLPKKFLHEVQQHCNRLAAARQGRTYLVPADAPLEALAKELRDGACYQTILSFASTPALHAPDDSVSEDSALDDYVAALKKILTTDGWIFMVEPTRPAGGPTLRSKLGSRFGRCANDPDLVTALRCGGLFVTDVQRLTVQGVPRRWHHYVVLKARRHTPPPQDQHTR